MSFIPGSPLIYPPKPKQYCQLKARVSKGPKHVFFRSQLLFSCHTSTQRRHPPPISLTQINIRRHTCTPPPAPRDAVLLPRLSCSALIMLMKWTHIIALPCLAVLVGGPMMWWTEVIIVAGNANLPHSFFLGLLWF